MQPDRKQHPYTTFMRNQYLQFLEFVQIFKCAVRYLWYSIEWQLPVSENTLESEPVTIYKAWNHHKKKQVSLYSVTGQQRKNLFNLHQTSTSPNIWMTI